MPRDATRGLDFGSSRTVLPEAPAEAKPEPKAKPKPKPKLDPKPAAEQPNADGDFVSDGAAPDPRASDEALEAMSRAELVTEAERLKLTPKAKATRPQLIAAIQATDG